MQRSMNSDLTLPNQETEYQVKTKNPIYPRKYPDVIHLLYKYMLTTYYMHVQWGTRVRHLSLFERAPAAYVSGANFLS